MKKEKLLVIATTFPRWEKDSEATFVKDLCKEQSKEFEVHVLVPHYIGLKLEEKINDLYIHRFIYFYPYKYQKLAYGGILPNIKKKPILLLQTPFFFISELINTMRIIKKENIKKIHAHWFFPNGFVSAICSKFLKVRSIITIHAGCVAGLNKIPILKRPITNFINKNKNKLKREYKIKGKNVILFLGRLAEKKGVKYLIQALNLIKNLDYILLIGGDGPLRKELEEIVNNFNLNKRVKFLGYITGKEKIDYILLSDIMIIPS